MLNNKMKFQKQSVKYWIYHKTNSTTGLKMYKFFSNCMIFDKRTIYRKHMKFVWGKAYDKMISVKVDTERLHIILLAYAVYYGTPGK